MKNKAIGFYLACVTAILAIVVLVVTITYGMQGGQVNTLVYVALIAAILCEASMFLGEQIWTDFTGIIAAALLAFVLMTVLSDGIWNIAEAINGIQMVGRPELASLNFTMAIVNGVAILAAILTCFTKKSK